MNELEAWGWSAALAAAFEKAGGWGLEPARIVEERRERYRIRSAHEERWAVPAGRLRHERTDPLAWPAVGDWVAARLPRGGGEARIVHLLSRRSVLVRKLPDRAAAPQVLAANLDVVFWVTSLNRDFNVHRIERALAMLWESGALPVVLLSKADLCPDTQALRAEAERVAATAPVHVVSSLLGTGLDQVAAHLAPARTAAFLGTSGVGKSTLVNRLAGAEVMQVEQIREADDRGRHTTTHRRLLPLPGGALVVDTPGLREVGLWEADDGMEAVFPEIEELAAGCRFRDCTHEREPGCAIRGALEAGTLEADRWESYRKLQRELAHLERRRDVRARLEEQRRWKRITMQARRRARP